MSVVNTRLGFVFLANPHTASRATVEGLLALDGSVEVGHHHCNLQLTFYEYSEASICPIVFHTVRHPFDWLVSRYLCNGGLRGEWPAWLRNRPKRPIFGRFLGQTTTYVTFENLKSDLAKVTGETVKLTHLREYKTPGKPKDWRSYWTDPELVRWAKSRFSNDMETYHYEF